MKQSTFLNNSVQFSSGGPQPLTLAQVQAPRKEIQIALKRTRYNRTKQSIYCNQTKQSTDIIKLIPDDSPDAFAAQTAAVAKSVDEEMTRENIMNRVNSNTTMPANY